MAKGKKPGGKSKSPSAAKGKPGSAARSLSVKVKTARGRTLSSTRWLQRQLNDPYVQAAQAQGFRSRSAFKLIEMDDKHKFLKKGKTVVDLGAAPGGWCQVSAKRVGSLDGSGKVVGIDLQAMEPLTGVTLLQMDFMEDGADIKLRGLLNGLVDIVLSDMAAASTGHRQTDHLRIMDLAETAHDFARSVLAPGGVFLAKVLQGGTENSLLAALKKDFRTVRHVKPNASRKDSAELYVLAEGFRATD